MFSDKKKRAAYLECHEVQQCSGFHMEQKGENGLEMLGIQDLIETLFSQLSIDLMASREICHKFYASISTIFYTWHLSHFWFSPSSL